MKKLFIVLIAFLSVFVYACRHLPPETIPTSGGTGGNGGGAGTNPVCFQTDILPIFVSNCAKSNCHDATTQAKGYVLTSYDNLFKKDGAVNNKNIRPFEDPTQSDLYEVLFETGNKKMPPSPNPDLSAVQKNLIARWIKEGAKNTTNCNASCDSNQFKFSANIQPVIQNHCTGCHSGSAPPNGVDLTTYSGVRFVAVGGLLFGVVAHLPGYEPMPKGSDKLSDCEIAQIRKWVQAGSLNN